MCSRSWVLRSISLSLIILMVMGITVYLVDPFYQYRMTDKSYFLKSRFVNAGIIKHYNYDTVIIGSSMMQNFNMQSFRDKLKCEPIKATQGGISLKEMKTLTDKITQQNKAKTMYITTDLHMFADDTGKIRFPNYLYDDNVINDYRYLFGYEVWTKFLPVNAAINLLLTMGIELPSKFEQSIDIDYLEYWQDDFPFGEDVVKSNYLKSKYNVSNLKTENIYERMISNFNDFIEIINFEKEIVFFFPPYSALYWYQTQKQGYYEIFQEVKTYIVNKLSENNVTVYDFQCMPLICDLNYYKDITHYSADVNEMMVDCFVKGDYVVTSETVSQSIESINSLVAQFVNDNSDWLK